MDERLYDEKYRRVITGILQIELMLKPKGDYSDNLLQKDYLNSLKGVEYLNKILQFGVFNEAQIVEYLDKIDELYKKIGFASAFLVRELSKKYIEAFDRAKWQSITKIVTFTRLDYEAKKGCLRLCGAFGIFEKDINADNRTKSILKVLKNLKPEELSEYSNYTMNYDPEFLIFWEENREELSQEQMKKIQNNWDIIRKVVEIKNKDNVLRFLDINGQSTDSFEAYMQLNNIPTHIQKKYKIIYEQMAGRTKTSIPTRSGRNENGYSYEVLNFDDIRSLRFGEDALIKCCQKVGGNGEGSLWDSAIEASSRVVMVRDELGRYIAGSLVTHQIGKDGKSYVCFDSIEVNAKNAHIKADEYKVTLKRIERLKKNGLIKTGTLEELYEYYKNNPPKERKITKTKFYNLIANSASRYRTVRKIKALMDNDPNYMHITKDDLKALEANRRILEVYTQICEDMIEADSDKRKTQLENGEISLEEYNHLLMRNGLFTVGKNPVSMYLGSLNKLERKSMEKLPVPQKHRSIYRKASALSLTKFLQNVGIGAINTMTIGVVSLILLSGDFSLANISMGAIFTGAAVFSNWFPYRRKIRGIYSDSIYEQRILKDGRENDDSEAVELNVKRTKNKLQQKLQYNEVPVISNPIMVEKLKPEEQRKLRLLSEVAFERKITDLTSNKLVIGNLENWAALFSNRDGALILENVLLPSPMKFSRNVKKLTDAQNDLISNIVQLNQSGEIVFDCQDKRINRYLSKMIRNMPALKSSARTIKKELCLDDI